MSAMPIRPPAPNPLGGIMPPRPSGTGLAGVLAGAKSKLGGMLPTVRVGSDPAQQMAQNQAIMQRLQQARPSGPWSTVGNLAGMALANRRQNKLADAKAEQDAQQRAAQGKLIQAMMTAKAGGIDPLTVPGAYDSPIGQKMAADMLMAGPQKWDTIEAADGYKYWINGPDKGKRVIGGAQKQPDKQPSSVLEYEYHKAEAQARGEKPLTYAQFKQGGPEAPQNLVTLMMPDGTPRTFRKGDPAVDQAIGQGATVYTASVQSPSVEGLGLGRKAQDTLQGATIDTHKSSARIDDLMQSFDPDYMTVPYKAKMASLSAIEKVGGKLTPEQSQELQDFTQFRQTASEHLNRYIKEMTGAQMSEREATRLRKSVPDYQKDGPTQFKSKLDNSARLVKAAQARYTSMLENGIDPDALTPKQLDAIYEKMPIENFIEESAPTEPAAGPDAGSLSDEQLMEKAQNVAALSDAEREMLANEWDRRGL